MTTALTFARAQIGIEAPLVSVESYAAMGLPKILIVGLPETAVKESKDRVRAAIVNSGFHMPGKRLTVNLSPADLPKQGGRYDLPIAIAILMATDQLPISAGKSVELMGELALDGTLRPVHGVLPASIACKSQRRQLVVPFDNAQEVALSGRSNVFVARCLRDVVDHLLGVRKLVSPVPDVTPLPVSEPRLSDIRGQQMAKQALVIAAAGSHNMIMVGPPGTGKTMLAKRLIGLLPPLDTGEAVEVASVQSTSRFGFDATTFRQRPFRSPHHTASAIALVGGGNPPRPGEISLAHRGILFLDELPEYPRSVLEVLREPLESGSIIISRANHQVRFPTVFQLVAAMNPCPCGYFGDDSGRCRCGIEQIERYRGRVSGPLMDRIDLHVDVPSLPKGTLSDPQHVPNEREHELAISSVLCARDLAHQRSGKLNAHLTGKEIEATCKLERKDRLLLETAMEKLGLSARGYYKVLKVARTIADLSGEDEITTSALTQALGFRRLDRYAALQSR